jgi:folylpolyglutamate synthase
MTQFRASFGPNNKSCTNVAGYGSAATMTTLRGGSPLSSPGTAAVSRDSIANKTWEDTLAALESLITKRHREKLQTDTLSCMEAHMRALNINVSELSVVHVAGTKGKGSTCTMVESILRKEGYRTGLYMSPHIVDVRERIRVLGKLLSKEEFTRYFWTVYTALHESGDPMPGYFRFLTCLAFYIFSKSDLDVIVLEVGLGGRLDATNIVPKPVVCGVSSLGLDHTNVLGNTIEEIAMEKAGIFKKGVPVVTVEQKPEAMEKLQVCLCLRCLCRVHAVCF